MPRPPAAFFREIPVLIRAPTQKTGAAVNKLEKGRTGPRKSDPGEKSRRRFFKVPRLRGLGGRQPLADPAENC